MYANQVYMGVLPNLFHKAQAPQHVSPTATTIKKPVASPPSVTAVVEDEASNSPAAGANILVVVVTS